MQDHCPIQRYLYYSIIEVDKNQRLFVHTRHVIFACMSLDFLMFKKIFDVQKLHINNNT